MVLRLKRPSHSPSPFSWDSLTTARYGTPPPTETQVAELPSPPTSWLSARDMKIFGVEPLRSDLGVVRCSDCDKPVLRSAVSDHASECIPHCLCFLCLCHSLPQRIVVTYDRAKSGSRVNQQTVKVPTNPLFHALSSNNPFFLVVELKKGKKRGADGEDGDDPSEPSKKKTKITKGRTKGPVDYDKQCGVINDKGLPCSRSLTCKAHSMGAKRAVQGRSKSYDELHLEWNRANNPNWVEPVKKETKAEKKEKREKEKAEKKRLAMEAAIASGMDPSKAATKKAPKKAQVPTTTSRLEGDEAAENLDDLDSEAEVDSLVKAVQEAQSKGIAGVPLAVPSSESSWFVVRRERLRNCRDLLASALAPSAARSGVSAGITIS